MKYFVVWPDGQKFGPADVGTLNGWIAEGRVTTTTELEDAATGARLSAASVPGLVFPSPATPADPVAEPEADEAPARGASAPPDTVTPAEPTAVTRASYYVVWPDGQKFGPADVDTLTQWAAEGRLGVTTELEVVETGARVLAGSVDGLILRDKDIDPSLAAAPGSPFQPGPGPTYAEPGANPYGTPESPFGSPQSPYAQPPGVGSPYPRSASSNPGQTEAIVSFVCSGLTFLTCCTCLPLGVGGIVLGVIARNKGNSMGTPAMIVGIVATLFSVAYWSLSLLGMFAGNLPGL